MTDKVIILPEEVVQLPVPDWQFFADRGDLVTVRDIKAEGWKSLYMFASDARAIRDNFIVKLNTVFGVG